MMAGLGHGQIWWADLDTIRPVVVLTRENVAPLLHRVLVAPITTTVRDIPSEVPLGATDGLVDGSVANLDNIQLVPAGALLRQAGAVDPDRWPEFCAATAHVIGC